MRRRTGRPGFPVPEGHAPRSGLTLLEPIRDVEPRVPIIVVSATEDRKVAAARHVETRVATFFNSATRRTTKPNGPR